jgi:hypothetical protein
MVSEMSAGKCEGESGGGKRPYEPPKVLGLNPVYEGRGAPTRCESGSGNDYSCLAGNAAISGNATLAGCDTGNLVTM